VAVEQVRQARNDPAGGQGDGAQVSRAAQSSAPSVALPKGGGAIRGIGEKFATNPVTGTASMSVPILTSPGRAGFGPQLSLAYDSGNGNSATGFGWHLSLPNITRKTSKGFPRYDDPAESDVFVLGGAEDLVPQLTPHGGRHEDRVSAPGYIIHRYRPRIESVFARIERWTRGHDGDVHWRVWSTDNILTIYGLDANSRIADPRPGASRVFSWLICESWDDRGNATRYVYKADDGAGIDPCAPQERHRGPRECPTRTANRYLKRVYYGNRHPMLVDRQRPVMLPAGDPGWMFEVVLDYGEHDALTPTPREDRAWLLRPDPFSSYRAGFEVRTARLCQRILMFHHFPGEPGVGSDCLVRSTDLRYADSPEPGRRHLPVYSFLQAVTQTSYLRTDHGYLRRSLPPIEFDYAHPAVQDTVEEVDPCSLANLPAGVDGNAWRWVDLHGEGIAGILAEQGDTWFYKRNSSALADRARFEPLETVALKPNVTLRAGASLIDLDGDGRPDVVLMDQSTQGLFKHDDAEGWLPFRPFDACLNTLHRGAAPRFTDLDGDGHADVLSTDGEALLWYSWLADGGFSAPHRVSQIADEDAGPRVLLADTWEAIYLADMSGDGMDDLVRIGNGEVCYWPNLGYGRFGPKVIMAGAPTFDQPGQFDQQRVRLADIDGSGTTDIIYLHPGGVRLYFNQSGNAWSEEHRLPAFPGVDEPTGIVPVDLLGNGTACLAWSSSLPGAAQRPMRYVNLIGKRKPHLLIGWRNNLGSEVRLHYASSTRFYLQDKRDGRPWVTRLPFPVHVVERVETTDYISRSRFVSCYTYHHGHYDSCEREFRGFGMVEQWDTEAFASVDAAGAPAANADAAYCVPAVHTKTWYHTGIYLGGPQVADYFAGLRTCGGHGEYFREPGLDDRAARAMLLPDTILPPGLDWEEEREACRALKGAMLRQEVFGEDPAGTQACGGRRADVPYSVTEQNFTVRVLQHRGTNRHTVFLTHARESIRYQYERKPADPRIQHTVTLEVDDHGNVLKEAAIGYGRRATVLAANPFGQVHPVPNPALAALHPADRARQATPLITYTENRVTNGIDLPGAYRHPLPYEACTYELTGYDATGPAGRYQAADFVEAASGATPGATPFLRHRFAREFPFEATPAGSRCRRLIAQVRTLYRRDDLTGLAPLGELEPLAFPGEDYKLAFTPGLLASAYRRERSGMPPDDLLPDADAILNGDGGYLQGRQLKADGRFPGHDPDDRWWAPSGRSFYSAHAGDSPAAELAFAREHFYLPRRYRNPFGRDVVVSFDEHALLMLETRDALGNTTRVEAVDYRLLQARVISDANRNRSEVAFDILGMVVGTAVMGKPLPAPVEGDTLADFISEPAQAELDAFFDSADPHAMAQHLLQGASTRTVHDIGRFYRTRAAHPGDPSRWQPPCSAAIARATHVAAPLPAQGLNIQLSFSYFDGLGREIQKKREAEPAPAGRTASAPSRRWVASGWIIFNNKGKPVRQFEPFFSASHRHEFDVRKGVSPVLFYDPLGRIVATLHPNDSFEKIVRSPWWQASYDTNDTCLSDPRSDEDVASYVAGYFATLSASWRTWHAQRIGGERGGLEQRAAARAAAHADTPALAHFDALGRPCLTVSRNRVACPGHAADGKEEVLHTRVELDIDGNQLAVRDAMDQAGDAPGRVAMRYVYDMMRNRIRISSMDAGTRWILSDVANRPIRAWDSRGHRVITDYDALGRPVAQTVRGNSPESDPRTLDRDLVVDQTEYGESLPNAEALNLRTRIYRHFDSAGVATNASLDDCGNPREAYDFKGNLLHTTRRLLTDYKAIPDWAAAPRLDDEYFAAHTRFDALNRPTQFIAPHSSLPHTLRDVIQPVFNEANLLARLDVWLGRADAPDGLLDRDTETPSLVGISAIAYNAMGQRLRIDYRNATSTRYHYDPLTFRLARLHTVRTRRPGTRPPADRLQDFSYTYDPVGNLIHTRDDAEQAAYFRNQCVEPGADYVYDAMYRLIQGSGREHLGQRADGRHNPPTAPQGSDSFHARLDQPGDGQAMGAYREQFLYDAVGNFLRVSHRGAGPSHPGWTREYVYDEPSLIDGHGGVAQPPRNNRLSRTTRAANASRPPDAEPYRHDAHGNLVHLPHLGASGGPPNVDWDYRDQMCRTDLGGGGAAWYVYDAAGQRIRKVWEKAPGLTEERIYLDGFELFRRHGGEIGQDSVALERATLHLLDDARRIALVETRTLDTAESDRAPRQAVRYQLGDQLGSVSLELDDDGQIVSYEEYAPYGSTTYQAVRSQTETPKRYRFTGKERDEESGLSYHGARYYAPWLGRWTSCDPKLSVEPYVYCRCNPATMVDPDGRESTLATRLWGGVRVLGGAAQALVGAAVFAQIEVPVAAQVVGGIAVVHGVSDIDAGFKQMITGREERSIIEKGVSAAASGAGASPETARAVGTGVDIGLGFVSPVPASGGPRMGYAMASGSSGAVMTIEAARAAEATRLAEAAKPIQLYTHAAMAAKSGGTMAAGGGEGSGEGGGSSSGSEPAATSGEPTASKAEPNYSGGATRPRSELLAGDRAAARADAIAGLWERRVSGTMTQADIYTLNRLESQHGAEAIVRFEETGRLPRDFEFSHLYSASEYPEFARRSDLGVLTDYADHIHGHHGGDTTIPLHGEPRNASWAEDWGYQTMGETPEDLSYMGMTCR
jgi:RHS repeat-associated protein